MKAKLVWHYTPLYRLVEIVTSGKLLPGSGGGIADPTEQLAVWFSREQGWEPTAVNAGFTLYAPDGTRASQRLPGERGRIGVDPEVVPLLDFDTYIETSRVNAEKVRRMRKVARELGANPRNWLCTYEPVGRELWEALGYRNGMRWENYHGPECKFTLST